MRPAKWPPSSHVRAIRSVIKWRPYTAMPPHDAGTLALAPSGRERITPWKNWPTTSGACPVPTCTLVQLTRVRGATIPRECSTDLGTENLPDFRQLLGGEWVRVALCGHRMGGVAKVKEEVGWQWLIPYSIILSP